MNNFFWLFLTYILSPYFYGQIFFLARRLARRSLNEGESPKILIIQLTKIGDLVCTTPVFREIKEKLPSSHLAVLVRDDVKDVLKNNPRIDEIISVSDYGGFSGRLKLVGKLRREKYDWVFNFSPVDLWANIVGFWAFIPDRASTIYGGAGEMVKALSVFNNHRLEFKLGASLLSHYLALLKFLGIEAASQRKEVFTRPKEEKKAADFLRAHDLNKDDILIGISCSSGIKFNQWEPAKFADLADQLTDKLGAKIIFIGSPGESTEIENIQKMMHFSSASAAGFFTLRELAAFMRNLKLFVGVDTGPVYIADALDVPVLVIAGPDSMAEQRPTGAKARIIKKNIHCSPCLFVFSGIRYCREGHLRCIKEISVEEVFRACRELLTRQK